MGYPTFFNNLDLLIENRSDLEKNNKEYLGINPIIIFRGVSWGNIVHMFQLQNKIINGGSITRRHKLSISKYRLSVFIDLIDLFKWNKQNLFNNYSEKTFTSGKFDRNNKIAIKNPYVNQFIQINEYLSISLKQKEIEKLISTVELKINSIKLKLSNLKTNIEYNINSIIENENKILRLKKASFGEGLREKHKSTLALIPSQPSP